MCIVAATLGGEHSLGVTLTGDDSFDGASLMDWRLGEEQLVAALQRGCGVGGRQRPIGWRTDGLGGNGRCLLRGFGRVGLTPEHSLKLDMLMGGQVSARACTGTWTPLLRPAA